MSGFVPAEASSSRIPPIAVKRARSQSRKRGESTSRSKPNHRPSQTASPVPSNITSHVSPTVQRKVRTVPPSALYTPDSPPTPLQPPPVEPASSSKPVPAPPTRRRRRHRTAYDTSSSDADSDSTDDEPPWWTFTQRGMMKMRTRSLRRRRDVEMGLDADSGRESGRDVVDVEKRRKGKSKIDGDTRSNNLKLSVNNSSVGDDGVNDSFRKISPNGQPPTRRGSGNVMFRRVVGRASDPPRAKPRMMRSNSAPSSPIINTSSSHLLGLNQLAELAPPPLPRINTTDLATVHENGLPRIEPRRQLTAPFTRFRRRNSGAPGSLTDTDITFKPRRRLSDLPMRHGTLREGEVTTPEVGRSSDGLTPQTPTRPKVRRAPPSRLRLNLPPPLTSRLTHGFHAGTWQDALYGYYSEDAGSGGKRPPTSRYVRTNEPVLTPDPSPPASPATPPPKKKTRKPRRYLQAQVPPTPSGLGFTPTSERARMEGRVDEHGFVWSAQENGNQVSEKPQQVVEEDNLSRFDTRATVTNTEKGDSMGKKGLMPFKKDRERRKRFVDEIDWKQRARRYLFLDARVTIWIRAVNLAVVVALLGLAITIRLDLFHLNLPGLLGSSTTLIISYSSLTALHVLTAIYREYFGKPIGLWALRSKMLWVCLDLLFVALWSSAMSVASNDFISTPLHCTKGEPWWRSGLSQSYSRLLDALEIASETKEELNISNSLGITLPIEIMENPLTKQVCNRQAACIGLSLFALLLYGGNMVLSLFRIFETVRRTANPGKAMAF
ncbi:hypothetical protein M231_00159 [Tremella mesenterica]|uniref:Uncharacterized protein n=1 Tax=Tremella mesenterica TaxID=5217 RepID=A0A4Q1BWP7_TREME|nr:hypothetical protein M231_00159 [Tremella mesenterica]